MELGPLIIGGLYLSAMALGAYFVTGDIAAFRDYAVGGFILLNMAVAQK